MAMPMVVPVPLIGTVFVAMIVVVVLVRVMVVSQWRSSAAIVNRGQTPVFAS